jgi:hypothetical protein
MSLGVLGCGAAATGKEFGGEGEVDDGWVQNTCGNMRTWLAAGVQIPKRGWSHWYACITGGNGPTTGTSTRELPSTSTGADWY